MYNSFKLVDFHSLCLHIDTYAKDCGVNITYLSSPKTNKDELARSAFDKAPSRTGLIAAFSSVELVVPWQWYRIIKLKNWKLPLVKPNASITIFIIMTKSSDGCLLRFRHGSL